VSYFIQNSAWAWYILPDSVFDPERYCVLLRSIADVEYHDETSKEVLSFKRFH
jgi:hypothetical protein